MYTKVSHAIIYWVAVCKDVEITFNAFVYDGFYARLVWIILQLSIGRANILCLMSKWLPNMYVLKRYLGWTYKLTNTSPTTHIHHLYRCIYIGNAYFNTQFYDWWIDGLGGWSTQVIHTSQSRGYTQGTHAHPSMNEFRNHFTSVKLSIHVVHRFQPGGTLKGTPHTRLDHGTHTRKPHFTQPGNPPKRATIHLSGGPTQERVGTTQTQTFCRGPTHQLIQRDQHLTSVRRGPPYLELLLLIWSNSLLEVYRGIMEYTVLLYIT